MITSADILSAKILIVDDLVANVQLLEGMLRVAGYTSVHSTTDPLKVCDLHRENRYSLILLDLQMPGLDGFQVMSGLKEIEADGYLPVLVVTAQPDHKLRALEAGAKDFVGKPFDMAELKARVHNILEVRLFHLESRTYGKVLEETVRELEASRAREFTMARETQSGLLPRTLPSFDRLRVHAFNHPTSQLGGNFYDFRRLPSGECIGVMADVSGKGMPAALLSSMVLGALSVEFCSGSKPGEILDRLNQILFAKSQPLQFVTLFLFLLNQDGTGEYISAGHNPAYLFQPGAGKMEELCSDGYMLGMFAFPSYKARTFQLNEGDVLMLCSDGLTGAESPLREEFGKDRLLELYEREAHAGGLALKESLLTAIAAFTENSPQADDVTCVIVENRT